MAPKAAPSSGLIRVTAGRPALSKSPRRPLDAGAPVGLLAARIVHQSDAVGREPSGPLSSRQICFGKPKRTCRTCTLVAELDKATGQLASCDFMATWWLQMKPTEQRHKTGNDDSELTLCMPAGKREFLFN